MKSPHARTKRSLPQTQRTPASNQKSEFRRQNPETVLLAVTGMSPAILTETLWALAHPADGSPPILPTRVLVVTTTAGRDEIRRLLFSPLERFAGQTPWATLRAALAADGHNLAGRLRFGTTPDDLRVLTALDPTTGQSRELPDIRTPADNEAAADFLLETVRGIVENPDTRLIASIAGGRKTMGALLYACLTLAGRETDRLTHVLVREPFETLREFFFPGQPGGLIAKSETRNPKSETPLDPADARLDLADIPFVPLRNLFVRELGRKAGTFSRLVESCRLSAQRRAAEHLRVSLDTTRPELEVNGVSIRLAPTEALLLWFLARRAKHGEPPFAAYKDAVDDLNAFRREQVEARSGLNDWRHADSLRPAWEERDLTKAVSSIRAKLRQQGDAAAVLAACLPEKGRCSLDVPGPLIFLH